jgi:CRISPR-associated protein Csx14
MRAQSGLLIATLGTKPQVVTTTLDLLLAQRISLSEVWVVYTESPELDRARAALRYEFAHFGPYQSLQYVERPLQGTDGALPDPDSEAEVQSVFRGLYATIRQAKLGEPPRTLHLSIVGGRKVLGIFAVSTAQLLFGDEDRLWYTSADRQAAALDRLHLGPEDGVQLVAVPVLRWGHASPLLLESLDVEDPFQFFERQRSRQLVESLEMARAYALGLLTPAEREVVDILVREGASTATIAARTGKSAKTVENQLSTAFDKAALHWGLPSVSRAQLIALVHLYFLSRPAAAEIEHKRGSK